MESPPVSGPPVSRRLVLAGLLLAPVACGVEAQTLNSRGTVPADTPLPGGTAPVPATVPPGTPVALVQTAAPEGLGTSQLTAVAVGAAVPLWSIAGAVAAPDGSAIYAAGNRGAAFTTIDRIDPRTGERRTVAEMPTVDGRHVRVAAVSPGDGRVVLARAAGQQHTSILVIDAATGAPIGKEVTFEGELDPEALSPDAPWVFAARIYDGGKYHVHYLDLSSGEQWPTAGPWKSAKEPEDMYGNVVQAALSPDGRQLATLYRDPVKPGHTAFVHLLDLGAGWTICIDLHEPFGMDQPGVDAVAWRDGVVAIGHTNPFDGAGTIATFDPQALLAGNPEEHFHADARPSTVQPQVPAVIADTPGFLRFVATNNS